MESKKALALVFRVDGTALEIHFQGIISTAYGNNVYGYAGAFIGLISPMPALLIH